MFFDSAKQTAKLQRRSVLAARATQSIIIAIILVIIR